MFRNRVWMYAIILFVLVGAILATQVSWIIQSARIEESFLNQRVNMALCSAMDVLSKDKAICSDIESCVSHSPTTFELTLNKHEKQKIDSVILQHLLFYNINVPFQTTFSPYTMGSVQLSKALPMGQALLYPVAKAGMQNILVHIEIPSKAQLIRAQINSTFILSMVVLALLIIVFFNTLKGLIRERKIRKETIDFINTMAHDLKTPISNISFALSLLSRDRQYSAQPANQYISIIDTETTKLKQRARKILGIASIDAVLEERADKSEIEIHKLLTYAIESFSLQLQETNGVLNLHLDARQSVILGSELQLTSAVMNIIDNAILYTQPSPAIQVRTKNTANAITIEIEDNGHGIPAHEQRLVFKKGYRMHNGKKLPDGFGLGLYLAKTLIEKQGGKLTLSSDGIHGSCFSIQLPLA